MSDKCEVKHADFYCSKECPDDHAQCISATAYRTMADRAEKLRSDLTAARSEIERLKTELLLWYGPNDYKSQVAALQAKVEKAREALERVLDCLAERKLEICIDCAKMASAALSPATEVKP